MNNHNKELFCFLFINQSILSKDNRHQLYEENPILSKIKSLVVFEMRIGIFYLKEYCDN